jgi:hypothetical protein
MGFGKNTQNAVWAAIEPSIINHTGLCHTNLFWGCADDCDRQNFRLLEISGSEFIGSIEVGVRISVMDFLKDLEFKT